MKSILLVVLMVAFLSGCGAPRYTAKPIHAVDKDVKVVIIDDKETRRGFQETMESWLQRHNYSYTISPDGSKHDLDKLTLEYVGYWHWDMALYLKHAEIDAYHNGQRVGEVEYRVPNTLNFNKFGNGAERIGYMMDILFGELTVNEANKLINSSGDSYSQDNLY